MDISGLAVKLIILLTPGFVSFFIYKRLTSRPNKRSDLMFISISIFLGILCYTCLQLVCSVCGKEDLKTFEIISFETTENGTPWGIPYMEVLYASFFGVLLAYIFSFIDTNNFINRIGIYLKCTTKSSDEMLYSIYLSKKEIDWVYIRDIKNSLTYWGKVFSISEKENSKEIVLEDVTVFTYPDSVKLYEVPSIYLNFGNENVIIEQAQKI